MSNSLSLDREKTVKRSKHAVVVWLTAALVPSLPRPSAKRTQNEIKKRTNVTLRGRTCRKDGPVVWNDRVSDVRAAFPIISEDRETIWSHLTLSILLSAPVTDNCCGTVHRLTKRAPWISLNRRFVVSGHTAKGNNWFGFSLFLRSGVGSTGSRYKHH